MSERAKNAQGPLVGVRVIEFASKGPGPYCSMLLSDSGADVLRLDRAVADNSMTKAQYDPMNRGRRSVAIDLKNADATAFALDLIAKTDVLIEGMRPGVMERLGLGPTIAQAKNPRREMGGSPDGFPVPPLNLVGDYGGGMLLAFGIVAALYERSNSNAGQVIDAAMIDASASMMTSFFGMMRTGQWSDTNRGNNVLDGGAPFYTCYQTSDDKFVAIGAVEAKFFTELLTRLGLPVSLAKDQNNRAKWPEIKERIAALIRKKSRDEWAHIFADAEICLSPVMTLSEAPAEAHNQTRGTFIDVNGIMQPAPAPRFERTPGAIQNAPSTEGSDTISALTDWGYCKNEIDALIDKKVLFQASEHE